MSSKRGRSKTGRQASLDSFGGSKKATTRKAAVKKKPSPSNPVVTKSDKRGNGNVLISSTSSRYGAYTTVVQKYKMQ